MRNPINTELLHSACGIVKSAARRSHRRPPGRTLKTYFINIFIIAAIAAGCAGPRFRSPEIASPDRYVYGNGADTARIDTAWWRIFGDTALNRLIDTALQNNKDMAQALSRLEQSRLQLGIARTQYLPALGLGATAKASYDITAPGITQQYSLLPAIDWQIGFFGKMQRASQAARAEFLASQYTVDGMRLALAAQVADGYFQLQQYRLSLQIARITYALRSQADAMIDSMFTRGLASGVDLQQARSLTATAAAEIPGYRRAAVEASLALDVLLGRNPTPPAPPREMPGLDSLGIFDRQRLRQAHERLNNSVLEILTIDSLMSVIPAGLPSSLLDRRADIALAYQNAAAASARAGLAKAERYPSITLTGTGGLLSSALHDLLSGNPFVWSAGLQITQPVFAYGSLRRKARIADEAARQAVLEYEKTVISAFSDVEGSLAAITAYREQTARLRELLRANFQAKVMTDALYRSGMSGYLDVLEADRSLYNSQLLYIETLTGQLSSYIAFFKALGGGFQTK